METGTAKAEITGFKKGVGMMGYGMHFNIVKSIKTPLYARAYIFRNSETGKKIAFVNAEMCFITLAVKHGVIKKLIRNHPELGLNDKNVMLTAQHTHSGPGGYSEYGLYNITTPGFAMEVYQDIVEGITNAIVEADANLKPSKLRLGKGVF